MRKILIILTLILICTVAVLPARANDSIAVGGQLGFLASGAVIDIPLGPLAVQAGINYPLGFEYIKWATDSMDSDFFIPFFVVTADVTYPISLGPQFDLKVGASTLGFTDFESGIFGAAGLAVKGEYWIEGKDMGIFANLSTPVLVYISTPEGTAAFTNPLLPVIGLISSTFGVLFTL